MSLGGSPENRDPQTCCPGWDIRIFELASENLLAGWELWEFCKLETQSRRGRRVLSETLSLRSPRLCVSKFRESVDQRKKLTKRLASSALNCLQLAMIESQTLGQNLGVVDWLAAVEFVLPLFQFVPIAGDSHCCLLRPCGRNLATKVAFGRSQDLGDLFWC